MPKKKTTKKKVVKKEDNPLRYKTKSGKLLSEQETLFVELMVSNRGRRIEAIQEAYDLDTSKPGWKNTASTMASQNLLKPTINEALKETFSLHKMTDESVDRELQYVIDQDDELSPKVRAINEYNKITGRHAEEKRRIIFENLSTEELEEEAARIIEETISD